MYNARPLPVPTNAANLRGIALWIIILFGLGAGTGAAQETAAARPPSRTDASSAVAKKDDGKFLRDHEGFLQRGRAGPIGVLFLGDSITENWNKAPAVWKKYYGDYHPANFGIGGDTTQNVIWRLEHGELDGIDPQVVVLLIGTNNSASHTVPQITAAVQKIVGTIEQKLPRTKILLLAIFPRGPRQNKDGTFDDGSSRMKVIAGVNAELAKMDNGKQVLYLDIGSHFLDASGKIPKEVMADQLHPTPAGYQIWADAMQPTLTHLLGAAAAAQQ